LQHLFSGYFISGGVVNAIGCTTYSMASTVDSTGYLKIVFRPHMSKARFCLVTCRILPRDIPGRGHVRVKHGL